MSYSTGCRRSLGDLVLGEEAFWEKGGKSTPRSQIQPVIRSRGVTLKAGFTTFGRKRESPRSATISSPSRSSIGIAFPSGAERSKVENGAAIEGQGGTVTAESRGPGTGATFGVELPLEPES